ncbi:MAG TPA: sugar nucleotide-binding protein [Patescibacteria group bacterium]
MKKSLLTTGLNGLVGSKFRDLYADTYEYGSLDISNPDQPVDITDASQVVTAFKNSSADSVIHLAAYTDVTGAWEQRNDKNGIAYKVNVTGTENIITACRETGKHLIHVSTAFVFDGNKEGLYTEEDPMNPIEWYGQTKAWAEEAVQQSDIDWTILRIDFPFRSDPSPRPDIVRKTLAAIEKGYPLFSNHYFGPTFIDDFAKILDWSVRTRTPGLFHASSGEKWSDYQLGLALKEQFHLETDIKDGNLDDYLKTLNRPYQRNTAMDCSKLKSQLEFSLTPVSQALSQVHLS